MKRNVITEIDKIKNLMNVTILNEQAPVVAPVVSLLRRLVSQYGDDVYKTINRGRGITDDVLNKIKDPNATISPNNANIILRNINWDELASLLYSKTTSAKIPEQIAKKMIKQGKSFDELLPAIKENFNKSIPSFTEFPDELQTAFYRKLKNNVDKVVPLVSRQSKFVGALRHIGLTRLSHIIQILKDEKKSVEILERELFSIIEDIMNNKGGKTELTAKLMSWFRASRKNLKEVYNSLTNGLDTELQVINKQLSERGLSAERAEELITQKKNIESEIEKIKSLLSSDQEGTLLNSKLINNVIKPNYSNLVGENLLDEGVGDFFNKGFKALPITFTKGKYFIKPKITGEGIRRLWNFFLVGSAQTLEDILKRIVATNPGQNKKWIAQTYARAIGPGLIIPVLTFVATNLFELVVDDVFAKLLKKIGYEPEEFNWQPTWEPWTEHLAKRFSSKPYSNIAVIEPTDLLPAFNSYAFRVLQSLFTKDYQSSDSTNSGQSLQSVVDTVSTNLRQQLQDVGDSTSQLTSTSEPSGAFVPTFQNFKELFNDENAKDLGNGIFQHSDGTNFKWNGELKYFEVQ
jgi:hypothetical protein